MEERFQILALLADFFPEGWDRLPDGLRTGDGSYLANHAASALYGIHQHDASLAAYGMTLRDEFEREDWTELQIWLVNVAISFSVQNRLTEDHRLKRLTLDLVEQLDFKQILFRARYDLFVSLKRLGVWAEAEALWKALDPRGRRWGRGMYRPGEAEHWYAEFHFQRGDLTENILKKTERLASEGKSRVTPRSLHSLRGMWCLDRGEPDIAANSFEEAVRMASPMSDGTSWIRPRRFSTASTNPIPNYRNTIRRRTRSLIGNPMSGRRLRR